LDLCFVSNNLTPIIRPQFGHLSYTAAGFRGFLHYGRYVFINRWRRRRSCWIA